MERIGILVLILLNLYFTFFVNASTYDDGDSILHYLQSKNSFNAPHWFLDHWAKPFFVLLSSIFTQFGFVGMKVFNSLCVILATFFAYRIAQIRLLKHAWFIWVMAFFAPHVIRVQSSGLTEPLFALVLIASCYFVLRNKYVLGLIIFSFLPFVRSEGWILGVVLIITLLVFKKWKHLAWLLTGTVLYSIVGAFYHGDLLWVFTQNPYQGTESMYGSGDLWHFVNQMPYLFGWPLILFLAIGLIVLPLKWLRKVSKVEEYHFWIYGMGLAMLVAHSIFWSQGWFHSFGMQRVLLAVFPCYLVIALEGLDSIIRFPRAIPIKRSILFLVGILFVWFPFSGNKAGFTFPKEIELGVRQDLVNEVAQWYKLAYEDDERTVVAAHYYFVEALDLELDNEKEFRQLRAVKDESLNKGDLVFWDDYFAPTDMQVPIMALIGRHYTQIASFEREKYGRKAIVVIFEKN